MIAYASNTDMDFPKRYNWLKVRFLSSLTPLRKELRTAKFDKKGGYLTDDERSYPSI